MSEPRPRARKGLWAGSIAVLLPVGWMLLHTLPKDLSYGAPSRFVQMLGGCSMTVLGLAVLIVSLRGWRDERLHKAYGSASSAVNDTLSYLTEERRLARRGQLPCALGCLSCLALALVAMWPQARWLATFQEAMLVAAMILGLAVPLLGISHRSHYINAFFLRRYLRQQLKHLGQRKAARRRTVTPRLSVPAPGMFTLASSSGAFTWHFDDFVKSTVVFGQVGAGKTVAVLNALLEGLIAAFAAGRPKIGGLILDAKGDFHGKIEHLCARYGRSQDLAILDPDAWAVAGGSWRSMAWNPLDNDDDPLEIASRLIAGLRLIGMESGNEGSFFLDSAKIYLRHAIALVRAAGLTPAPSLIDVYRLSQESEGETPLYHALIEAINARYPGAVPEAITDAIVYLEREWAPMAERQKSGVRGTITQLLDEFLVPPFREIFTQASTVPIGQLVDEGRILYVHMPAAGRERMSRLVNTLIKLEYQRAILARPGKSVPSFFLCDEFQTFYTSGDGRGDSDFVERSRESFHANIFAAQNLSAFYKRTRNLHDVKNFLGNCAVKIFLRQTEAETNRWASGLFGTRSEIVVTTSEQAALDGSWSRRRHTSYGRATRALPRVPPEAFVRLAIPVRGDPTCQEAASIIHIASRGKTQQHEVLWPVHPLPGVAGSR